MGKISDWKRFGKKKLYMDRYCNTNWEKSLKEDSRRRDYLISKHLADKSVSMDEVYLMYRQAMKSGIDGAPTVLEASK